PLEEITGIVTDGVPATLMAGWGNTLTAAEIDSVIQFILRWPDVESAGVAFPEIELPTFPSSPEMIAAGDKLFHIACKSCHGVEAYGSAMAPSLNNPTFLSETPDAAIYQIIAGGVPETLMPAWGSRFAQTEMESLVAYLRSLEQSSTPILQP
ncbi:MAG TPA: c-type cytochrome, partial [Anaerolineales bacterium]|nr:c-type cytochrome [Anaerolineales bacterium]